MLDEEGHVTIGEEWTPITQDPGPPFSLAKQDTGLAAIKGGWIACHEPERPPDDFMCVHYCCPACLLKIPPDWLASARPNTPTLFEVMEGYLRKHGPADGAIPWRGDVDITD